MSENLTKTELGTMINELEGFLGRPLTAAWKIKDLTKVALEDLHSSLADDWAEANSVDLDAKQEDEAEELDPATTEPVRGSRYNEAGDRRCGCCGNYFPPSAFGEYKRSKDGLASYTKEHTSAYRAKK